MEKISYFLDENYKICSFQDSVKVVIYEKQGAWKKGKELEVNIKQLNSMYLLRKYFMDIVVNLDDCKIVVVKKAQGIPYGIFYESDYSIWELDGVPEEFLDLIIDCEKKHIEKMEEEEQVCVAKKLDDGYYLIDLNELQFTKPEMTSKKAIIPFLDKFEFDTLEVLCCHIPPWLIEKEKNKEISMEAHKLKKNEYKLLIKK